MCSLLLENRSTLKIQAAESSTIPGTTQPHASEQHRINTHHCDIIKP
jgi:hypothetical protein